MERSVRVRIGFAIASLLLALVATTPGPAVAAPGAVIRTGVLHDVVAIGPSDVWAVGSNGTMAHWDGGAWQTQRLGGTRTPRLTAVDAVSSTDAWVVGNVVAYDQSRAYLSRWNGSKWIHAEAPTFPGEVGLTDVVAVSPTEAWAVGWTRKQTVVTSRVGGIILHWNGTVWRRIHAPPGVTLSGVTVVNGAPIVSGERVAPSTPVVARLRPLGLGWRITSTPEPAGRACALGAIAGAPPVAAGNCVMAGISTPYVVARDGGVWDMVPAGGRGVLNDIAGGPVAWSVGRASPTGRTLALRRRPSGAWFRVATPPSKKGGALESVDVRTFADAWAVGWSGGAVRSALVLRWDGSTWAIVPAP